MYIIGARDLSTKEGREMNGKNVFRALASMLLLFGVLLVPLTLSTVIEKAQVVRVASPNVIYVDGNNTGDLSQDGSALHPFDAVQKGVNAAFSGGTIEVAGDHTYYETVTINKSINLTKWGYTSDPVIDGSRGDEGYVIGIYASDVIVSRFTIKGYAKAPHYGVYVYEGNRTNIIGNVITRHDCGIYIETKDGQCIQDLSIADNVINDTVTGIEGKGTHLDMYGNIVYSILGVYVAKNTIYGSQSAYDTGAGISLNGKSDQIVENGRISGFNTGIDISFSENASVYRNYVFDCSQIGVGGSEMYDCAINGNDIRDCKAGIQITTEANNNTIEHNFFYQINESAIGLYGLADLGWFVNSTVIRENTVLSDSDFIDTAGGYGNNITDNDLFGRYRDVPCFESGCTNYYTSNYWNNYNGTDIDGDGLGETPYLVAMPDSSDYYPRVRPYGPIPFMWEGERYSGTMIGNVSMSFIHLEKTKIIAFNVSGQGYCNFTIPRNLLDGSFKISINNTQIPWLSIWNVTHTSIYFEYETSAVVSVKIEAQMRLIGDVNSDGKVDILDIALVATNFWKKLENP